MKTLNFVAADGSMATASLVEKKRSGRSIWVAYLPAGIDLVPMVFESFAIGIAWLERKGFRGKTNRDVLEACFGAK